MLNNGLKRMDIAKMKRTIIVACDEMQATFSDDVEIGFDNDFICDYQDGYVASFFISDDNNTWTGNDIYVTTAGRIYIIDCVYDNYESITGEIIDCVYEELKREYITDFDITSPVSFWHGIRRAIEI